MVRHQTYEKSQEQGYVHKHILCTRTYLADVIFNTPTAFAVQRSLTYMQVHFSVLAKVAFTSMHGSVPNKNVEVGLQY